MTDELGAESLLGIDAQVLVCEFRGWGHRASSGISRRDGSDRLPFVLGGSPRCTASGAGPSQAWIAEAAVWLSTLQADMAPKAKAKQQTKAKRLTTAALAEQVAAVTDLLPQIGKQLAALQKGQQDLAARLPVSMEPAHVRALCNFSDALSECAAKAPPCSLSSFRV